MTNTCEARAYEAASAGTLSDQPARTPRSRPRSSAVLLGPDIPTYRRTTAEIHEFGGEPPIKSSEKSWGSLWGSLGFSELEFSRGVSELRVQFDSAPGHIHTRP